MTPMVILLIAIITIDVICVVEPSFLLDFNSAKIAIKIKCSQVDFNLLLKYTSLCGARN